MLNESGRLKKHLEGAERRKAFIKKDGFYPYLIIKSD